jgi:hypothetical protein
MMSDEGMAEPVFLRHLSSLFRKIPRFGNALCLCRAFYERAGGTLKGMNDNL